MSFMDFSSWPREQEQSFVVFEQRANESTRKAFTIGGVVAGAWLVLMIGIFVAIPPEHKDLTQGMNMDNLTKKSKKVEAEGKAPAPAAAPAEKPAAEAEKPAAEGDKPADDAEKKEE